MSFLVLIDKGLGAILQHYYFKIRHGEQGGQLSSLIPVFRDDYFGIFQGGASLCISGNFRNIEYFYL